MSYENYVYTIVQMIHISIFCFKFFREFCYPQIVVSTKLACTGCLIYIRLLYAAGSKCFEEKGVNKMTTL